MNSGLKIKNIKEMKMEQINKIKRLIVTLLFPKTLFFLFVLLIALITLTILRFIPAILGTTLTMVLLAIVGIGAFLLRKSLCVHCML